MTGVRIADPAEHPHLDTLYQAWGYRHGIRPGDVVYIAEREGDVVGIVRRAIEHGTTLLRGMQVRADHQRERVGSRLLDHFVQDLGDAECFCIPYDHLTGFYGRVGFATVESPDAPSFLAERLRTYQAAGSGVLIMRRPSPPGQA